MGSLAPNTTRPTRALTRCACAHGAWLKQGDEQGGALQPPLAEFASGGAKREQLGVRCRIRALLAAIVVAKREPQRPSRPGLRSPRARPRAASQDPLLAALRASNVRRSNRRSSVSRRARHLVATQPRVRDFDTGQRRGEAWISAATAAMELRCDSDLYGAQATAATHRQERRARAQARSRLALSAPKPKAALALEQPSLPLMCSLRATL